MDGRSSLSPKTTTRCSCIPPRTEMGARPADGWSASEYNKTAPYVYSTENTAPIIALLDPEPGEKIIDFGCGTGEVTLKLTEAVTDAGLVVGIDSSQSMASAHPFQRNLIRFFINSYLDQQSQGERAGERPCPGHPGAGRWVRVSTRGRARSVRQGL